MDPSQSQPSSTTGSSSSSPRSIRELQGPRPSRLRVREESHKIRNKPPLPRPNFPQPSSHMHRRLPLPRIIYTISPKVIHTSPEEFMDIVQRLTGPAPPASAISTVLFQDTNAMLSPAARLAVMDKISSHNYQSSMGLGGAEKELIDLGSISSSSGRRFMPSSILSPGPGSMAQILPADSLFSPLSSDPNSMSSFFQGLSPVMNQGGVGSQVIPSPGSNNYSNLFMSPSSFISPTSYSLDLFNDFGDL